MRIVSVLTFVYLIIGCSDTLSKEDLNQLNGYWEIAKVSFHDGNTKEYKVSTSIDFIKIDSLKGYRKKVQPKFDGTFDTSNDAEFFLIKEQNGEFIFHYKNNLSEWKEAILKISRDNFSVSNEAGITYEYKRFNPINVKK
ncbi:hypothetical protein [Ulvibacterium marinum]|uniref:Lipocalin-like domain-containing protein n=1 Tax=Ulvibacterium marinum TaxID=2419782 RepID=A0A3B0BYE1_9FLAO|nr:hypothetical protein [Ulvibacterium marinum]RKN76857.1 hypothetical protein D7Z94_24040 [Ulvibacterium marinum]